MLDFRWTSYIDYMLLNLANGIAKEHSEVFFSRLDYTLYQRGQVYSISAT